MLNPYLSYLDNFIWAQAARTCEHCHRPEDIEANFALTIHHLDGNPLNEAYNNQVVLCPNCRQLWTSYHPAQRCFGFARPEWMKKRGIG